MGLLDIFIKKRKVKALVKGIAEEALEAMERRELQGEVGLEGSKVKFAMRLVDVKPQSKIDLDEIMGDTPVEYK